MHPSQSLKHAIPNGISGISTLRCKTCFCFGMVFGTRSPMPSKNVVRACEGRVQVNAGSACESFKWKITLRFSKSRVIHSANAIVVLKFQIRKLFWL